MDENNYERLAEEYQKAMSNPTYNLKRGIAGYMPFCLVEDEGWKRAKGLLVRVNVILGELYSQVCQYKGVASDIAKEILLRNKGEIDKLTKGEKTDYVYDEERNVFVNGTRKALYLLENAYLEYPKREIILLLSRTYTLLNLFLCA